MARMSLKCRRQVLVWVKLTIMLILMTFTLTPLRNLLLSPFLPGSWRAHSTWRVVQMLMDNQRFPLPPEPLPRAHPAGPSPQYNLTDVDAFLPREDPYAEFFAKQKLLEARLSAEPGNPNLRQEVSMLEAFQPVMTLKERAQLLFTLHVFQKACERSGIVYFICEGTLLGYHRHRGLIPWDDDGDVCVFARDWKRLHEVLSALPGFTLLAPGDSQWKLYLTDLPGFPDKLFKFPYLDIFFMEQRGAYTWSLTWGVKNHLMLQTKHLLPLVPVQFESLTLPAPACLARLMQDSYGQDCATPLYVHKTNLHRYDFQTDKVDCRRLYRYLPFVFREMLKDGKGVREVVKVGGRVVQNITGPPTPIVCAED